eukprot:2064925-Rhodomonas_salina.2
MRGAEVGYASGRRAQHALKEQEELAKQVRCYACVLLRFHREIKRRKHKLRTVCTRLVLIAFNLAASGAERAGSKEGGCQQDQAAARTGVLLYCALVYYQLCCTMRISTARFVALCAFALAYAPAMRRLVLAYLMCGTEIAYGGTRIR